MTLAKDRTPQDYSNLGAVQACPFAGTAFGEPPAQFPVQEPGGGCSDVAGVFCKNLAVSPRGSSSISSTPSSTSSIRMYQCLNQQFEETDHSVISFSPGFNSFLNSGGSLLSFDQNDHIQEYPIWGTDSMNQSTNPRLLENSNSVQTSGGYGLITGSIRENPPGGEPFRWLNPEETTAAATIKELEKQEACANKRSHPGDTVQAMKKQCTDTRKTKIKATSTKDPQSIAAKNRRERISDRLKALQDLVPNGSKVDLVTMLEKAISYVKFLQLQVKVLATDEFWPVQGGKAPDLAQVREVIDSILASQRDSNSRAQSNGE